MLWFFYSGGVVYFILLCGVIYGLLLMIPKHRGVSVAVTSVAFLLIW